MSVLRLLAVSFTMVLSSLSFSHSHSNSSDLEISQAWARASAPGAPSAGFMMVHNNGHMDDVLLSVNGTFAKKLEVHQTKKVDGVMKMMHQKDGVVIPAGGMVMFKPGGYHLMFMGLKKNFEEGETYSVTLTFEHAGEVLLELPVMAKPVDTMSH
jgi:copper(I)-binding protein